MRSVAVTTLARGWVGGRSRLTSIILTGRPDDIVKTKETFSVLRYDTDPSNAGMVQT